MADTPAADRRSIGQRRLAAILFTDVVSFSARVQQNESLTLRLVKRDFEAMTRHCTENNGQVLKTTGDGLLMSFPTATAAVACAQKIQTMLAHNAKKLPPEQVLEHRIGIHLGDVFVEDADVMGNDVNIAARVLSEAGGGEICVSQTVYDIVKNRLTIKGVFMGQRELKNIGEVPIYKLPMNEEQAKAQTPASVPKPSPATPAQMPPAKGRTPLVAATIAGILLVGGIATWAILSSTAPQTQTQTTRPVDPAPANSAPSARFVGSVDRGGDWKGEFGSTLALVFGDTPDTLPSGPVQYPLESGAGTLEARFNNGKILNPPPLREAAMPSMQRVNSDGRITAALSAAEVLRIGLRFPDSKPRKLTLFCAHAGKREPNRTEVIAVVDPVTNAVLAVQTIKNFQDGVYVSFEVASAVELRLKAPGDNRAVISGLFIDPAGQ